MQTQERRSSTATIEQPAPAATLTGAQRPPTVMREERDLWMPTGRSSSSGALEEQEAATITGTAGAAVLAAGIGCLAIGVMATLSEASESLSSSLKFVNAVGPLSGKTAIAVVIWLVAWAALHAAWKDREKAFAHLFAATLVLVVVGVLGTFPIFFELFAAD